MSEKEQLSEIDGKLTEAYEALQAIVEARTEVFDGRSEKWQEGDKGVEYNERTEELRAALDSLENAKDEVSGLVEID